MILSLIATLIISSSHVDDKLVCPVMGGAADLKLPAVEYAGAKYWFCCGGCDSDFKKDPTKYLATVVKEGSTAGLFLFDPVTRERLDMDKAKGGTTDYKGVRYPFANQADKDAFLKSPDQFASVPKQESLYCAVGKETVAAPSKASSYYDYKGVRYFMCCAGCETTFAKTPDVFADQSRAYVKDLLVVASPIDDKVAPTVGVQTETFACRHCGKTMKVNGEGDLKTRCKVCGCGKDAGSCRPDKSSN